MKPQFKDFLFRNAKKYPAQAYLAGRDIYLGIGYL